MAVTGGSTAPITSNPLFSRTEDVKKAGKKAGELGKDDFLNLLVAQLKNQDPLNPMKDTEFVAQLANFSSLEQTTSMNKNMEEFLKQQQYQNSAAAVNMMGMQITSAAGETGIVTGVKIEDSGIFLTVNGKQVPYTEIKEVNFPVQK